MTDVFHQRYYKINRFLLGVIGQWPYYSKSRRLGTFTLYLFFMASVVIPQIIAVVKSWDDTSAAMDSMPSLVVDIAYGIKFSNLVINSNKMLKLFERIEIDWMSVADQPEVLHLLQDAAEVGRQFTIAYAGGMYVAMVLFMLIPILPQLVGTLHPANVTEPRRYPFPIDYYGIDTEVYYCYLLPHCYMGVLSILIVIVAADTTLMVQVQHACGMFAVVGHQMQTMADKVETDHAIYTQSAEDPVFRHVAICIQTHKDIIHFSELLRESYTWSFFCIVIISSVFMSITGFLAVVKMDDSPEEALRFAAVTMGQFIHLFFQNFIAQRLIDQSERVGEFLYQAEWYRTSPYTRKLLNQITMRTRIPCQLTASKFYVMSLESFSSLVKASVSYFTLFRTMQ